MATFPVIDIYVLDKALDRYRRGSRKLAVMAENYRVAMGDAGAHDAGADVIASLRIAWRIASWAALAAGYCEGGLLAGAARIRELYAERKRPEEIGRAFLSIADLSVTDLHHRQVKWAAEQAEGLRDHFMRNPDNGDAATVSGAWPVRPITTVSTTERI